MKKTVVTLSIIAVSLLAATVLLAAGFDRGRGPMWGGGNPYCFNNDGTLSSRWSALGLTEEQKAKLQSLREAHLRDIKPLQDQLFSKKGDLRLLWLQPTPDREKILALQKEIRNLQEQIRERKDAFFLDTLNVLTPEQQAKLKQGRGFGPKMPHRGVYGPGHQMGGRGMMGY